MRFIALLLVASVAHAASPVGRTIDVGAHRITVGALLGEGHSGQVYAGTRDEESVALKIGRTKAIAEQLAREHATGKAIEHVHPAIMRMHDRGHVEVDGERRPLLVVERVAGEPLGALRGPTRKRDVATTLAIARKLSEVAAALEHAGYRHNDLHPENVFIEGDDPATLRLIDLGRVAALATPASHTNLAFAAPERRMNLRPTGVRSDIYAFGAIVYALLAGHAPPSNGKQGKVRGVSEAQITEVVDGIEEPRRSAVAALLRRCLRTKPSNRFQSFDEVRAAIADIVR